MPNKDVVALRARVMHCSAYHDDRANGPKQYLEVADNTGRITANVFNASSLQQERFQYETVLELHQTQKAPAWDRTWGTMELLFNDNVGPTRAASMARIIKPEVEYPEPELQFQCLAEAYPAPSGKQW